MPDKEPENSWLNEDYDKEPEAAGTSASGWDAPDEALKADKGGHPVKPEKETPDLKARPKQKKSIVVPAIAAVAVVIAAALGSYFFFIAREKPVTMEAPVKVQAPISAPVVNTPEGAAGPTALEAQPPQKKGPRPTARQVAQRIYYVQLGSFAEKDNAARLTAMLKKRGYKVFIREDSINGKAVSRVLAGGFLKRDNACKLADKLSLKEGVSTSIHAEWTAVNPS